MAETLLSSLFSMFDTRSIGGIARSLGASENSVLQGLKSSSAAILGAMASKSHDQGALRHMLDAAPSGDTNLSQVASAASDPNSPMLSSGKRILSNLFGGTEDNVAHAVGSSSGLNAGAAMSLLTMAAPMVMGFLGKRVRSQGMSMGDLGNQLQRESSSIRGAMPPGMADTVWPATTTSNTTTTSRSMPSPVVAQTVKPEPSGARWLPLLALLLLIPFFSWMFHHARRPMVVVPQISHVIPQQAPTGEANRAEEANRAVVPPGIDLRFQTASSRLQPESAAKLNQIANTLKGNSNAKATISGYTDNIGDASRNLQLSQQRANHVMAELIQKGVPAGQLTAKGFGEHNPIASNATDAGRALNRRVSVAVTQP